MKLTIFNGSPRGQESNTKILLDSFLEGFESPENEYKIFYLIENEIIKNVNRFINSPNVILAFPLYTDAMPGIVKDFIEKLGVNKKETVNASVGFMVQSGFPEAYHSRCVERYLIKLSRRMHWNYQGTLVKGGVEGIKNRPGWMNRKLFKNLERMGEIYSQDRRFDPGTIKNLAPSERFSPVKLIFVKFLMKTGLLDSFWNQQLKKNQAYEKRFARPYKE